MKEDRGKSGGSVRTSARGADPATAPLPTRDAMHLVSSPRTPASRTDLWLASSVVAAIIALALIAVFLPQPRLHLTQVRYETTSCDPTTGYVATAVITLTNDGSADGFMEVWFSVDGERRATQTYLIPAHTSIERRLSVAIPDCGTHRYDIGTFIPGSEG